MSRPGRWRSRPYDRDVSPGAIPVVLAVLGALLLAAGVVILRTLGPGYRVGRLLATVRSATVAEARAIATAREPRYVAVTGRIDADEPFEDAAHRPLVLRRTLLEARSGRGWRAFEDSTEAVPFRINEALDSIGVRAADLGPGLVVVPRESRGTAEDLGDRAPEGLAPATPVRVTVRQISAVEQATVLGQPVLDAGGEVMLAAGLGRPLVLTTLERDEAMRVLARGETRRPRLAAICLSAGAACIAVAVLAAVIVALGPGATTAFAASPSTANAPAATSAAAVAASPAPSALGGDTRSSGEGPGLVGAPALAILGVVGIGLLAVVATLAYVRLTGGPRRR
jgi:hypothetical protein